MEDELDGLIQSCHDLDVKNDDDDTVTLPPAAAPSKWLKLIDANGKEKRAKRCVCFIQLSF